MTFCGCCSWFFRKVRNSSSGSLNGNSSGGGGGGCGGTAKDEFTKHNKKASGSGNASTASSTSASMKQTGGNPRNKTALRPGHSLMDWIRLGSSGVDLTGTGGVITAVSHAELATHNKVDDCWLALRGRVYNITRYMDFHPGGRDELMRGAGKDATALFDSVHAWVNYEQLLSKCLVGPLRTNVTINLSNNSTKSTSTPSAPLLPPNTPSPTTKISPIVPRFDWIQKSTDILLTFYTRALCNPGLIVEQLSDSTIHIKILIEDVIHVSKIKFVEDVRWPCTVRVVSETGKIELLFIKTVPNVWTNYGSMNKEQLVNADDAIAYEFDVQHREEITHDSSALLLMPKDKIIFITPIGYHVNLTATMNGTNITRSYTPVPRYYSPITASTTCMALLVKASGVFSQYITRDYPLATQLRVSRPVGTFQLTSIKDHRRVALLAAGSGLTPMLGVLDHLLKRTSSKLEFAQLLLFNKSEKDIWCKDKLDTLFKENNLRLAVRHILSSPTDTWTSERGLISKEQLNELVDTTRPNHVTFIAICGPISFNNLCSQHLRELNFAPDNIHFFQG